MEKSGQATSGADVEWDDLDESFRLSNLAQAHDVDEKLQAIGCEIHPLTEWEEPVLDFTPAEVECLAKLEHGRWCKERTARGYVYGPVRDDKATPKTHHLLVLWDDLPEEERDKDRAFIRAIPAVLATIGFQVGRRDGPGSRTVTSAGGEIRGAASDGAPAEAGA